MVASAPSVRAYVWKLVARCACCGQQVHHVQPAHAVRHVAVKHGKGLLQAEPLRVVALYCRHLLFIFVLVVPCLLPPSSSSSRSVALLGFWRLAVGPGDPWVVV